MGADAHHPAGGERESSQLTRRQLLKASALGTAAAQATEPAAADPGFRTAPRVVEYWIAAVPVSWNMMPNGRDAIDGVIFRPEQSIFTAVAYRGYTPGWKRMLPEDPVAQNGLAGPTIRGRVGDTILVHFKNLDRERMLPHSMHFHGVHYRPESDGGYLPGFSTRGADVKPGQIYTYTLHAKRDSVGTWPYHDHSPSMHASLEGGMYGAMIIAGPGQREPDRDFLVFFAHHQDFMTINGRAFVGNTPVFRSRVGERVRFNVLTLGDDFHTFHLHGHRWRAPDGTYIDTRTIGPAESFSLDFVEDAPGTWFYHCHVESHMQRGMIGIYQVRR